MSQCFESLVFLSAQSEKPAHADKAPAAAMWHCRPRTTAPPASVPALTASRIDMRFCVAGTLVSCGSNSCFIMRFNMWHGDTWTARDFDLSRRGGSNNQSYQCHTSECVCESARHTDSVDVSNFQHNRTVHFITDSPPQPHLHAPWLQFTRTCALQLGCPGRLKLVEEREGAWHT